MATLFLRSYNINDITAANGLGYWTNTVRSNRVQVGDKVVVFANKKACKDASIPFNDQMVLVGYLTALPYYLEEADVNWPSSREGTHLRYYARFELENTSMEFLHDVEGHERLDNLRGHLRGGLYVEA